jgi:hypothetical protein
LQAVLDLAGERGIALEHQNPLTHPVLPRCRNALQAHAAHGRYVNRQDRGPRFLVSTMR